MYILGIETSCDETGVAVYDSESQTMTHSLHSQIDLHADHGGVVPELAARDHIKKIAPLVKQTLSKAQIKANQLQAVAYTAGPGLISALLTGATFAASFAFALKIPAIPIHHLEAHLLAPLLEKSTPTFPFLALLVSGGHTQLIKVEAIGNYQIIGETLDDAVGEAFDKTARLLKLSPCNGATLAKLAQQGKPQFTFSRPMIDRPGLDFSFSGLKTQVQQLFRKLITVDEQTKANIALAFQTAAIDTLVIKCERALQATGLTQLVVAGGVSANLYLRQQLMQQFEANNIYFPRLEFCTDNGAMIAFTGYQKFKQGVKTDLAIQVFPRWDLTNCDKF